MNSIDLAEIQDSGVKQNKTKRRFIPPKNSGSPPVVQAVTEKKPPMPSHIANIPTLKIDSLNDSGTQDEDTPTSST